MLICPKRSESILKEGKKIVAWPDWRDDITQLLVQPQQTEELKKGRYHPGVYCKAHYKPINEFELIGVRRITLSGKRQGSWIT